MLNHPPFYRVSEIGPDMAVNRAAELLARLGDLHAGLNPGQFILATRHLPVDSRGDIYVGEVQLYQLGPPRPRQGRGNPARPQEPAEASGLATAQISSPEATGMKRVVSMN